MRQKCNVLGSTYSFNSLAKVTLVFFQKIACRGRCPCPDSSNESSEETMETDETNYCGCTFKGWDPVCGYDGQFYNNYCDANCAGIVTNIFKYLRYNL